MANKKLRWYHYLAKIIFCIITLPASPILILVSLAGGDGPFYIYEVMWNEGKTN